MAAYQPRLYREEMNSQRFHFFPSVFMESDLLVGSPPGSSMEEKAVAVRVVLEEQKRLYRLIRSMGEECPEFLISHEPLDCGGEELPPEIALMLECGRLTNTGPMSSVAGLFARAAGRVLREEAGITGELVVENGGDLYLENEREMITLIHAGEAELSGKLGLRLPPGRWGVCTSSGTLGHSFSGGQADALCVVCNSAPLADAWATSLANRVRGGNDIEPVLELARGREEIRSCVILAGGKVGVAGVLELSVAG